MHDVIITTEITKKLSQQKWYSILYYICIINNNYYFRNMGMNQISRINNLDLTTEEENYLHLSKFFVDADGKRWKKDKIKSFTWQCKNKFCPRYIEGLKRF